MAVELAGWVANSPRFREFAGAHRDKIRKKLRGATDASARRDVRTELRVAQLLLADRRIEVAFESYGSAAGGPDFKISFRGERAFNLEVTRMHRVHLPATGAPLLAKLHQLIMDSGDEESARPALDRRRRNGYDGDAAPPGRTGHCRGAGRCGHDHGRRR